jgi:hypothetical protein
MARNRLRLPIHVAVASLAVGGGAVAAVAATSPAECTNVAQAPFEFSKIFATFQG